MVPFTRQRKRLSESFRNRAKRVRVEGKVQVQRYSTSSSSSSSSTKARAGTHQRRIAKKQLSRKDEDELKVDLNDDIVHNHESSSSPVILPKQIKAPPPLRWLPKELAKQYNEQVKESEGFDVDAFSGYVSFSRIVPIGYAPGFSIENDKELIKFAKRALTFYNKNRENKAAAAAAAKLKFARVVKANSRAGGIWECFITFEAVDADDQIKTLQAMVTENCAGEINIKLCRLKPTPPSPTFEADRF